MELSEGFTLGWVLVEDFIPLIALPRLRHATLPLSTSKHLLPQDEKLVSRLREALQAKIARKGQLMR